MLKSFPYEDSHHMPWKYDVSSLTKRRSAPISLWVCLAKPVENKVTIEEAKEFLKIIRNLEYIVIQQLNKSLA